MSGLIKLFFLFFLPLSLWADLSALYLSWYGNPTSTMAIQWHTLDAPQNELFYRPIHTDEWQSETASFRLLPSTRTLVHAALLSQLTPDTEYEFKIGSDPSIYRFRTMPENLTRPVSFVVGGEIFDSRKLFRKMAETILTHDPDFIVLGGNIAHANGTNPLELQSNSLRHWISFLSEWKRSFATQNGRIIPFLILPGDEDIRSDDYALFFSLFAFPDEQLYRRVDFGGYLTLFLLDSGHFHPIDGPQSYWLSHTLPESPKPYRFAVYNEAAYPSYDPYLGSIAKKIRTNWCPLFERFHIQAAFEHHNRAFKRTHPLKEGQIDESGVVYLGDGCWGAEAQKTNDQWYLAKKARRSGVWIVEMSEEKAEMKAIDLLNETIDELSIKKAPTVTPGPLN